MLGLEILVRRLQGVQLRDGAVHGVDAARGKVEGVHQGEAVVEPLAQLAARMERPGLGSMS